MQSFKWKISLSKKTHIIPHSPQFSYSAIDGSKQRLRLVCKLCLGSLFGRPQTSQLSQESLRHHSGLVSDTQNSVLSTRRCPVMGVTHTWGRMLVTLRKYLQGRLRTPTVEYANATCVILKVLLKLCCHGFRAQVRTLTPAPSLRGYRLLACVVGGVGSVLFTHRACYWNLGFHRSILLLFFGL